jgi:hypothetical protein
MNAPLGSEVPSKTRDPSGEFHTLTTPNSSFEEAPPRPVGSRTREPRCDLKVGLNERIAAGDLPMRFFAVISVTLSALTPASLPEDRYL